MSDGEAVEVSKETLQELADCADALLEARSSDEYGWTESESRANLNDLADAKDEAKEALEADDA